MGHEPSERVDLLDEMALADAADGRIAAHLSECFYIVRQQQGVCTHARTRKRSLGAGVAAADDDDVVSGGMVHDSRVQRCGDLRARDYSTGPR